MKIRSLKFRLILLILIVCSGCSSTPEPLKQETPIPQSVEILGIIETEETTNEITQTKTFDQRQSTSSLGAEITFSQTSGQTSERELVLGVSPGVEVGVSEIAKVELKTKLELHYKEAISNFRGHQETIKVTVPAGYMQEYTIVWRETRRVGTVRYVENGTEKTAQYNYRIGLELASTTVRDLAQPGPTSQVLDMIPSTPYPTYTPLPTFTPYPTYTPQPAAVAQPPLATNTPRPVGGPLTAEMGEWIDTNGISVKLDVDINHWAEEVILEVHVLNNTSKNLIFSWVESKNFKLYDNTGFVYEFRTGNVQSNENIKPGELVKVRYQAFGYAAIWKASRIFDPIVTDIYITVSNFSLLEEATWHLNIR